ncbi:hypothetical protein LQ278_003161 [Escherichia coli]|uniref:hypothetical protein n=1 Tax=Escherichia coli TaxID=562 RepID=UPI000A71E18C|nr:hypothetical protein [Escherichia coli]EHW7029501.1 hypothetical protein [Escherichia coli]EHX2829769.1 hypothetical protein [Escherichia coli]EHY2944593.1 hypothetical protein [Escherichia coli]EHY5864941.1 hypothetical protein [Escherichia coli]EIN2516761.1 hypothetical protein [Escherichia coli]
MILLHPQPDHALPLWPAPTLTHQCKKSDLFTAQAWRGHNRALAVLAGDSGGEKA